MLLSVNNISSKSKKLHIYAFTADVMWVTDIFPQRKMAKKPIFTFCKVKKSVMEEQQSNALEQQT